MTRQAGARDKAGVADTEDGGGGSRRRREILDIAAKCFAENGYEATSIREIADRAGILSGSLYHHFESKDDMLHQIVRPYGAMLVRRYREIAAQSGDAIAILGELLRFNLRHILDASDVQKVMYRERSFFRSSPAFEYVKEYYEVINSIFIAALDRAVEEGAIDKTMNTKMMEVFILRFVVSLIDPPSALKEIPQESLEDEVLKFVLRAIGAKTV